MRRLALVALLCAGPAADVAHAQVLTPPSGPVVLTLPASTRALALGNAFVTVADDPDAIFYNPALLSSAEGIGVSAQRFGEASTLGTFSAATRLGPGTLGAGARFLDHRTGPTVPIGDVVLLAGRSLFRGGDIPASSLAATLGYGLSFDDPSPTWLDDVRVGAAAHVLEERIGDARGAGVGFDVGAAVELEWLMLGLAVQNLGPELEIDDGSFPLPRQAVFGAAHESQRLGPLDVVTAATVVARDDGDDSIVPGLGVEVSYWPIIGRTFIARVGARHDPDGVLSPITVGAGFEADAFALDYAYERAGDLGAAHRVGLRWWR